MEESILRGAAIAALGEFLVISLPAIPLYAIHFIYKKKFKRFFGIHRKKLHVYLSNWYDFSKEQGPTSAQKGFVTEKELFLQSYILDFFNKETALIQFILKKIRGHRELNGNELKIDIKASPLANDPIPSDVPMIIIGSSVANYVRWSFVNRHLVKAEFENEAIQVPNSGVKKITNNIFIQLDNAKYQIKNNDDLFSNAIIERIFFNGQNIIFCCGFNGEATNCATRYLLKNWEKLHKNHYNKPFMLCIEFYIVPGKENEACDYNYTILDEKEWQR